MAFVRKSRGPNHLTHSHRAARAGNEELISHGDFNYNIRITLNVVKFDLDYAINLKINYLTGQYLRSTVFNSRWKMAVGTHVFSPSHVIPNSGATKQSKTRLLKPTLQYDILLIQPCDVGVRNVIDAHALWVLRSRQRHYI